MSPSQTPGPGLWARLERADGIWGVRAGMGYTPGTLGSAHNDKSCPRIRAAAFIFIQNDSELPVKGGVQAETRTPGAGRQQGAFLSRQCALDDLWTQSEFPKVHGPSLRPNGSCWQRQTGSWPHASPRPLTQQRLLSLEKGGTRGSRSCFMRLSAQHMEQWVPSNAETGGTGRLDAGPAHLRTQPWAQQSEWGGGVKRRRRRPMLPHTD